MKQLAVNAICLVLVAQSIRVVVFRPALAPSIETSSVNYQMDVPKLKAMRVPERQGRNIEKCLQILNNLNATRVEFVPEPQFLHFARGTISQSPTVSGGYPLPTTEKDERLNELKHSKPDYIVHWKNTYDGLTWISQKTEDYLSSLLVVYSTTDFSILSTKQNL